MTKSIIPNWCSLLLSQDAALDQSILAVCNISDFPVYIDVTEDHGVKMRSFKKELALLRKVSPLYGLKESEVGSYNLHDKPSRLVLFFSAIFDWFRMLFNVELKPSHPEFVEFCTRLSQVVFHPSNICLKMTTSVDLLKCLYQRYLEYINSTMLKEKALSEKQFSHFQKIKMYYVDCIHALSNEPNNSTKVMTDYLASKTKKMSEQKHSVLVEDKAADMNCLTGKNAHQKNVPVSTVTENASLENKENSEQKEKLLKKQVLVKCSHFLKKRMSLLVPEEEGVFLNHLHEMVTEAKAIFSLTQLEVKAVLLSIATTSDFSHIKALLFQFAVMPQAKHVILSA